MKNNIKKLLLSIGISIPLVFNSGDYNLLAKETNKPKQNKTIEDILRVPESVKRFKNALCDSPLDDKPVLVRLSRDVDTYIVTSKNGYHLNVLANKIGIKPNKLFKDYFNYDIGFSSKYNYLLKKISKKFDKNNDKVINISELSGF
jgi:hypothetical protein|tara:strand:- start:1510 stop:1947 length:438 start_codon:yes stop_codon:yes gene_type:complete